MSLAEIGSEIAVDRNLIDQRRYIEIRFVANSLYHSVSLTVRSRNPHLFRRMCSLKVASSNGDCRNRFGIENFLGSEQMVLIPRKKTRHIAGNSVNENVIPANRASVNCLIV